MAIVLLLVLCNPLCSSSRHNAQESSVTKATIRRSLQEQQGRQRRRRREQQQQQEVRMLDYEVSSPLLRAPSKRTSTMELDTSRPNLTVVMLTLSPPLLPFARVVAVTTSHALTTATKTASSATTVQPPPPSTRHPGVQSQSSVLTAAIVPL